MGEFEEWGELAWIPAAVLAGLLAWRYRSAVWTGPDAAGGMAGAGSRLVRWAGAEARTVTQWVQDRAGESVRTGNRAFDAYHRAARRQMASERAAFRSHRDEQARIREKAEFDAFMAARRTAGDAERPTV